jgi:DNA-binding CsgD family transcriptional regulator
VGGARPARHPGAPAPGRQGARRADERQRPLADRAGARREGRRAVRGRPEHDPERRRAPRRSFDEPIGEDATLADSIGITDPELGRARSACSSTARSTSSPTRDREILRLRFEEDLTQTEISRQIGVSQMQVSRLIRQALARLRMNIERSRAARDRRRVGRPTLRSRSPGRWARPAAAPSPRRPAS